MHYKKAKKLFQIQDYLSKDKQQKILESLWEKKKSFVTYFYSEFLNHLESVPKIDSDQSYKEQKSKSNFLPHLFA